MADGVDPGFQQALDALMAHAPRTISIASSFRTADQQAALHAKAEQDHPGDASKWAAAPGTSWHEKGLAADLRFADATTLQWAHEHAAEYGLFFPMAWEPWHVQPLWTQGRKSSDATAESTGGTTQPPADVPADIEQQNAGDPLARIFGTVTSMVKSTANLDDHAFHDDTMSIGQRWSNALHPSTTSPGYQTGIGQGLTPTSAGASGGTADYQKAYDLLIQAGAAPAVARVLAAVAGPESGYDTSIVSKPNKDGTVDQGLFQINSVHSQYDRNRLITDPLYNAQAALDIYNSQGFDAWTTYKNGAYKAYLPAESKAS